MVPAGWNEKRSSIRHHAAPLQRASAKLTETELDAVNGGLAVIAIIAILMGPLYPPQLILGLRRRLNHHLQRMELTMTIANNAAATSEQT